MPLRRQWTSSEGIGTLARSLIAARVPRSAAGGPDGDGAQAALKAVAAAGDDTPAAAGHQVATALPHGAARAGPGGARAKPAAGAAGRDRRRGDGRESPRRSVAGGGNPGAGARGDSAWSGSSAGGEGGWRGTS